MYRTQFYNILPILINKVNKKSVLKSKLVIIIFKIKYSKIYILNNITSVLKNLQFIIC